MDKQKQTYVVSPVSRRDHINVLINAHDVTGVRFMTSLVSIVIPRYHYWYKDILQKYPKVENIYLSQNNIRSYP